MHVLIIRTTKNKIKTYFTFKITYSRIYKKLELISSKYVTIIINCSLFFHLRSLDIYLTVLIEFLGCNDNYLFDYFSFCYIL